MSNPKLRSLLHEFGPLLAEMTSRFDDQGDLVSFGSTNDADVIRDFADAYNDYCLDTGDCGDDIPLDDDCQ